MGAHLYCDRIQRRDFLKIGALSGVGLGLADYLGLPNVNAAIKAKAN